MIPAFDEDGILPPGIHQCNWTEFMDRFAYNNHRADLAAGLLAGAQSLRKAGCEMLYIDGSFVTNKLLPGDFDACWDDSTGDEALLERYEPVLMNFDNRRAAQKAKFRGEFFPASFIAHPPSRTNYLKFFQHDVNGTPKGIVAIALRDIP